MHKSVAGLALSGAPKIKRRLLNHWDNLDGTVERGYAGTLDLVAAAGDHLAALHGLRARQRVHRHQRHGAQQRQRRRADPHRHQPGQGEGARRRVPSLRDQRLSLGALQRAHRDRRPDHRRSDERSRQDLVVEQGRRDLHDDPRLRRLPGQGQLRGATGAAGLRPHARRRGEDVVRRAGHAWRRRALARVRLRRQRHGPHPPGVRRVQAAGRNVRRQRDGAGQERPARLPAARAVQPAVRRDAGDAAVAGAAGHQGVPGQGHAPRLPGSAVRRGPQGRHRRAGRGSTVARVIDGTVHGNTNTAISGVANIGLDANWTGSHFNQANWYVVRPHGVGSRRHGQRPSPTSGFARRSPTIRSSSRR